MQIRLIMVTLVTLLSATAHETRFTAVSLQICCLVCHYRMFVRQQRLTLMQCNIEYVV